MAKSSVFQATGSDPTELQSYADDLSTFAAEAEASKNAAAASATSAAASATSASSSATSAASAAASVSSVAADAAAASSNASAAATSAGDALTYKNAAETAKTAAETAQTAAETAQTGAETAETNASSSATSASTSATSASTSATSASTSATSASSSATSASTSASNASTSETNAATSETNAAASATAAASSATAAAASETAAATSETNAASSATAASTSETNAATSATSASSSASAASTSETNAASSATSASGSATSASTSATAAAASQTAAASSESAAGTSETNAATSASSASTSATNAATSASNAATSETNAATSESNASTSATNAATSATAAAASQSAAAASAASAASAFDSFDDRYLGTFTTAAEPTVDNDGDALITGALYFNSTEGEMRVYDGSAWIAASAATEASLLTYEYTATAAQTTFSGADDNGATLSYTIDNIIVTLNGVVLDPADYTATNGTSIVLGSGAALNDELNVVAFKSFTTADMVSATNGGTFGNNITVTGTVTADGLTVDTDTLYVDSTNNRVGIGTSSPSANLDVASSNATIHLTDTDDTTYAEIRNNGGTFTIASDEGAAASNSSINFRVDGTERMRIDSSGTAYFLNQLRVVAAVGDNPGYTSATSDEGVELNTDHLVLVRDGAVALYINRTGTDGPLVYFYGQGNNEGGIFVSGSTISYNGGHLARWSQLADNTRDESILKGTVMTNLDQMAEWTNDGVTEDNEQLNCMAVSTVEGDPNVAGVFVNWDNDDDIYTNDMNIAMTGDMVIRIAQGTTVQRGDLLMSAGDGTAKPQGDDIVRSKTIAKVTSTHVSHTYDDGSYLVPCVLMAC